jgi:ring-1,2-phenylacetyl-CoA epoxidase subunit PaaC
VNKEKFRYCIHLADNALILGQRNSEWTGHGPVLEQDIAITNIALDLFGQARNFFQYAAELYNGFSEKEKKELDHLVPRPWKKYEREMQEDDLAFLRDSNQYLNLLLVELPKGDWAVSILRQFLFSAFQSLQFRKLAGSADAQFSAIAEKSLKEVAYHLKWSGEWVIRLGDGTEESKRRLITALDTLWIYTGEMFQPASFEVPSIENGIQFDSASMKEDWLRQVGSVFDLATISIPDKTWMQKGGKEGIHTEHLGYLLSEMQYLQRTYPNVTW